MTAKPKILIIGAGIGGLTAAIALRQAGFEPEVFERAPELKEIGAGIGLSANAVRVLKRLGLMRQVVEQGTVIEAGVAHTLTGGVISRVSTQLADAPTVCLHRADLQEALRAALPPECVHLGHELVDLKLSGGGVAAHFAGGGRVSGDALIGADGLRSRVRTRVLGDGEPVYRGYQCWRGVCPLPARPVLTETFGNGVRVGLVPIGHRGTAWWCTINEPEFATDDPDGAQSKLLRRVGGWHPPIPEVFRATDPATILKTGIYDRPPARGWSQGRCTLLGDAAHPTTPNLGQGGGMAIEDAVVLARCLSRHSDPVAAFRVYERLRHPRTARIVKLSRWLGVVGQWKHPAAVRLRAMLYRLGSGKAAERSYQEMAGYDPYEIGLE